MKLIYATGFSKNEKLEWKPVVFNNIVQSFRLIYDAMTELNIAFEQPESEVRFFTDSTPGHDRPLPSWGSAALDWTDLQFRNTWSKYWWTTS